MSKSPYYICLQNKVIDITEAKIMFFLKSSSDDENFSAEIYLIGTLVNYIDPVCNENKVPFVKLKYKGQNQKSEFEADKAIIMKAIETINQKYLT